MPTDAELLCAIFDSSPLGIGIIEQDTRFRTANEALQRMLGYSEEELRQLTADAITHPEDVDLDLPMFGELLRGERSSYEVEKRFVHKDGSVRWARATLSLHETAGEPLIIGMVQDVTERHEAAQRQRQLVTMLGERVKELSALHRAAVLLHTHDLGWRERMQALAELLPHAMQYPSITTAGVRLGELMFATTGHADTAWMLVARFETDDGRRGSIEVAYREPRPESDLGPFLKEEQALLDSLCEMLKAVFDRDRVETELHAMNERLNLALDVAGMGVWEWDVRSNTVTWSQQLAEMIGTSVRSGPFWVHGNMIHADDRERLRQRLELATEGGDDLSGIEFRFRRANGTGWRHMMGRARIMREPPQRATRILVALIDVSERRVLEEGLRQAQKVESLGQVASGVAHDFNNLLMVMLGGAEWLAQEMGPQHPWREVVDDVYSAAQRGAALTQQLLTFSRKAAFQPQVVDVCGVIERLQPILKRVAQKGVSLRLQIDADTGNVWADPTQLEQVVMNLVVNARDAMPHGGVIIVRTGVSSADDVADDARGTRFSVIEVSDTGTGIDPAVRDRIFEPFFTTKELGKGTGLGLAMVINAARQWGGDVVVQSELGKGTTFRVRLPRLSE